MAILETIKGDLIGALKKGDAETVSVLRLVDSAAKNKEIEKRTRFSKTIKDIAELEKQSRLSDEEIIELLMSEVKKRKEASEQFQKGSRPELAQKEEKEIAVIQRYLPAQLTAEQIREEALKIIAEIKPTGLSDFGKTMGALSAKLKGRADGKTIAEILKKELGLFSKQN